MVINKVQKYQLIYKDDDILSYKNFLKYLYSLQNEMFLAANKAVQLFWEFSTYQSDYKTKYNVFLTKKEVEDIIGYGNIRSYVYSVISNKFKNNNTANLNSLLQKVYKSFENDKKEVKRGEKSILSFKKNIPIEINKKNVKIHQTNKDNLREYCATISLFSNSFKKENNLNNGFVNFKIVCKDGSANSILKNIVSGDYTGTSGCIVIKNGKIFLHMGYSFEQNNQNDFVDGRIMGIDMGVVYPIYASFNDLPKSTKIVSGEIEAFRKQIQKRKRSIYEQTKYCGDGKIGHGYNTRTKGIEKIRNSESNFRDRINDQYSRYIVNFAYKNKCGIIQMEDLKGISKDNLFLKDWTYFDLQNKIEQKANALGIVVVKINPKYTSQRCSKCGYIDKENRQSQSLFVCKHCGYETNADLNASKNISTDGIEGIIEQYIKASGANVDKT